MTSCVEGLNPLPSIDTPYMATTFPPLSLSLYLFS